MKILEQKITIELRLAESIVIADFISRHKEFKDGIQHLTPAEKRALWNLECVLEQLLTEPTVCNYQLTLTESKKLLTDEIS